MAQTDEVKVKVTADVSSAVKGLKALNKQIRELIQNMKQLEIESRRARQEVERVKKLGPYAREIVPCDTGSANSFDEDGNPIKITIT